MAVELEMSDLSSDLAKTDTDNLQKCVVHILSLFPEAVMPYFSVGIVAKAIKKEKLQVSCVNIRDFATGNYKSVDDQTFGGSPGVVIQAEPVAQAIESLADAGHRILLSPNGQLFTQAHAQRLATLTKPLTFICGRYEGIDGRILDHHVDEVLSIGDFVISGGELAAMVMTDAIVRLIPGVLNNQESALDDSHQDGLLESPNYTRPANWRGIDVPPILLSGHHANIQKWRREESLKLTAKVRPELLKKAHLHPKEQALVSKLLDQENPS